MRLPLIFVYDLVCIPLFHLKQAILSLATVFRFSSPPGRRYEELRRRNDGTAEDEVMCSICLTEFARQDSVYELPDCAHVFHINCIEKWMERNNFTCPLCRCFFNIENRPEKLRFVIPDNPSCLYYFLQ
ncbi:RING-H2 finger protein ATL64 [Momordica charantia]|uniref:RING-H2 finger protein ATL64 n=1 Tax=Momordica charantia TaxID=3673 RepID=A0A6J1CHK3_MOMCH|nr:RING-H2 finger protein ATL64 [Momordica charantia]